MDHLWGWLGGAVILAAAAGALLFTMRANATASWRQEAEAQKQRGDRLEEQVDQLTERVEKLERDNAQLRDIAHGTPELKQLLDLFAAAMHQTNERHDENVAQLARLEGGISRLETGLLKNNPEAP